jgi:hypothetical protein
LESKHFVADAVPKEQDAVWISTYETGTIDYICMALNDGFEQDGKFAGIVFQISILHDDVVTGGQFDSGMQGSALTLVN